MDSEFHQKLVQKVEGLFAWFSDATFKKAGRIFLQPYLMPKAVPRVEPSSNPGYAKGTELVYDLDATNLFDTLDAQLLSIAVDLGIKGPHEARRTAEVASMQNEINKLNAELKKRKTEVKQLKSEIDDLKRYKDYAIMMAKISRAMSDTLEVDTTGM